MYSYDERFPEDTYLLYGKSGKLPGRLFSTVLHEINLAYGIAFLACVLEEENNSDRSGSKSPMLLSSNEVHRLQSMKLVLPELDCKSENLEKLYSIRRTFFDDIGPVAFRGIEEFYFFRHYPYYRYYRYYRYTHGEFSYVKDFRKGSIETSIAAGVAIWLVLNTVGQSFKESYKDTAMDHALRSILEADVVEITKAARRMAQIQIAKSILVMNLTFEEVSLRVKPHCEQEYRVVIADENVLISD